MSDEAKGETGEGAGGEPKGELGQKPLDVGGGEFGAVGVEAGFEGHGTEGEQVAPSAKKKAKNGRYHPPLSFAYCLPAPLLLEQGKQANGRTQHRQKNRLPEIAFKGNPEEKGEGKQNG